MSTIILQWFKITERSMTGNSISFEAHRSFNHGEDERHDFIVETAMYIKERIDECYSSCHGYRGVIIEAVNSADVPEDLRKQTYKDQVNYFQQLEKRIAMKDVILKLYHDQVTE